MLHLAYTGLDGKSQRAYADHVNRSMLTAPQTSVSVTYVTMGLPIVLMFVFLGKSLTLDGHEDGVKEYIGIW